jgi:hypothetical protein
VHNDEARRYQTPNGRMEPRPVMTTLNDRDLLAVHGAVEALHRRGQALR